MQPTEGSQPFRINIAKLSGSIANLECKASELYLDFTKAEARILDPDPNPNKTENPKFNFSIKIKFTSDVFIVDRGFSKENTTLAQEKQEKYTKEELTIICDYKEISFSLESGCCLKFEPEDKLNAADFKRFDLFFIKDKINAYDHRIKAELKVNNLHLVGKLGLLIKRLEGIIMKLR